MGIHECWTSPVTLKIQPSAYAISSAATLAVLVILSALVA